MQIAETQNAEKSVLEILETEFNFTDEDLCLMFSDDDSDEE